VIRTWCINPALLDPDAQHDPNIAAKGSLELSPNFICMLNKKLFCQNVYMAFFLKGGLFF
jgi:hypothetical protein